MQDINKQFITAFFGYAVQRDIAIEDLCDRSMINLAAFQHDPLYQVGPEQQERLWQQAVQLSGDTLFGLHFGEAMQLAALGIIGQIVQTSRTAGTALAQAGELLTCLSEMFQLQIQENDQRVRIQLIADADLAKYFPVTYRQMTDYLAAFLMHELDGLLLKKITPLSVSLPVEVEDPKEYERVLRCPVKQRSGALTIRLAASDLALPVISGNYALQQRLLQQVYTLLAANPRNDSWRQRIYHYLLANAYLSTYSLETVAANFNMSSRSLQRKLQAEGVTFLEIVAAGRQALARQYLAAGQYSVKEISYLLGYNEASAFIRAFKRWTGKTPMAYRATAAADVG